MCNFYFYYYGEADEITKITNDGCPNRRVSQVFNNYPSEGDTRFPFNKELEKLAAGRKDSFGN